MKSYKVTQSVSGHSAWIVLDQLSPAQFAVALGLIATHGANFNYSVQYSMDDRSKLRSVTWTRSSNTVTVTDTAHGMDTGDSVFLQNSGDANLDSAPQGPGKAYDITWSDANTYTITVSGVTALSGSAKVASLRVLTLSSIQNVGATGTPRSAGNFAFPVSAVRVNLSSYSIGGIDLLVNVLPR